MFPWVLSNYSSEEIDLRDPNNYRFIHKIYIFIYFYVIHVIYNFIYFYFIQMIFFSCVMLLPTFFSRDLSRPIGALNPERLKDYLQRYR